MPDSHPCYSDYSHVFLCRPAPGLVEIAADYPGAHVWPLAEITHLSIAVPPKTDLMVLTSANAVPAVRGRQMPVAVVGPQTAAAARAAGLQVVLEGTEDISTLLPLLQQQQATRLCHIHGEPARLDWHKKIQPPQEITSICAYKTVYKENIPPAILAALGEIKTPVFTIWSVAGAHHLQKMLKKVMIEPVQCTFICLSPAVAAAVRPWVGNRTSNIMVASAPHRQAMWEKVTEHVQKTNR